ncbi:MAG: hypothetical protein H0W88_12400 [Parachlamydiaceae bacterium]|nr:hypothetical protein [Parachlamydiaceae bacterium]
MNPDDFLEHFPLIDSLDHEILMHRDSHFGGQFSIMLDYYRTGQKGIQPEFDLARIENLDKLEQQLKQNLAPLYLESSEIDKIADAREAYRRLKSLYEIKTIKSPYPRMIADLILAEEEEPAEEIKMIVREGDKIVPSLIELLKSEDFYDSLFPGYGQAPGLAVICLGLIGDKRALISLFETLGHGDFFDDEQVLRALKMIGEPAKQFLLRVVKGHPINEDNEKAAIALIQFKDEPEVAMTCFKYLQEPIVQKDPCLPTYLVLACEGLKGEAERDQFRALAKSESLPKQLREDMKVIVKAWEAEPST